MTVGVSAREGQSKGEVCPGRTTMLENETIIERCPGMEELHGLRIGGAEKNLVLERPFEARMSLFKEPIGKWRLI